MLGKGDSCIWGKTRVNTIDAKKWFFNEHILEERHDFCWVKTSCQHCNCTVETKLST